MSDRVRVRVCIHMCIHANMSVWVMFYVRVMESYYGIAYENL